MGLEYFFIGAVVMFALIYLQTPIAFAMLVVGFGGYALLIGLPQAVSTMVSVVESAVTNQSLVVVPLFLMMGTFAAVSGLATDLYRLAERMIGHRRGGLLYATVVGCAVFGSVSGSSVATAATFGKVALPEMEKRGYAASLAGSTIAAGGTLGALVPPSIILVIYAIMTESFILDLFVAAVGPALIAVVFQMITIAVVTARRPEQAPKGDRYTTRERFAALVSAAPTIAFLMIILGGMYGGVFTVNEAAAVGAILSILFALFRGRLNRRTFVACLTETGRNTGMIYMIIFGADMLSYFVTVTGAPREFISFVETTGWPPLVIISVFVLMYIVLGSVFETLAAMLVTLPFILPVVESLGYDAVWWGIVTIAVVELGLITPPIGMNIFVIKGVAPHLHLRGLFAGVLPFVLSDLVRIVLIVLFPAITLFLLK